MFREAALQNPDPDESNHATTALPAVFASTLEKVSRLRKLQVVLPVQETIPHTTAAPPSQPVLPVVGNLVPEARLPQAPPVEYRGPEN